MKKNFIPYPFYWDSAPLDLSFLLEDEKPAGKHGFLKVDSHRFVFEDGTPARFWGTNINSGANFPEKGQSEKIARRLASFGINIVRFHQLDAEWSTPNIFQFSKGRRKGNTMELDPESMERLDYLFYCLKNEGIYLYLDLLTYRKFKAGDGIENASELRDAAKPYSIFDRKLIDLQKKFAHDVWTHVNPYTGLAYMDDPAIVLTEVVNENDLFSEERFPVILEPYRTELEKQYREWAKDHKILLGAEQVDFTKLDGTMAKFFCHVQERYFQEMSDYMKGIGVKIPITGTNWATKSGCMVSHRNMDFYDGHTYWYDWEWKEEEKKFKNEPMVASRRTFLPKLLFSRVLNKPYFVSEWDEPWPNEWRAESSLYLAAISALQGWGGCAIHTYRYSNMEDIRITGKEVSSKAIGSVPYREGVFNTFNDPAKFGLFYSAAIMLIRGDIEESKNSISVEALDNYLLKPDTIPIFDEEIGEKCMVGMRFCQEDGKGAENVQFDGKYFGKDHLEVYSDTGQLYRNWGKGFGWINTGRSKAAYGFLGSQGPIALGSLSVDVSNDFAVISVNSLMNAPIEESDNMLITTIGRSENTGMKFNDSHDIMLDVGEPPIRVEAIRAKFRIKTKVKGLRVLSINAEGFYAGEIPSKYEDGHFEFETGNEFVSMYYLLQAD